MVKRASEQSARFIEAAKAGGADEDPAAFERAFGKVVPPKAGRPKQDSKKPSR